MATIKTPPSVIAQFSYLLAFEYGLFFKKIGIYGVLLAFFGVGFLVGIVGYMALCVGFYLVIPLIFTSNAVAFRKIFPPGTTGPADASRQTYSGYKNAA